VNPFSVLVADPPWSFSDRLPGKTRGAAKNYATLSLAEIEGFALPPIADDALLFLWRVSAMVPEAYAIAKAWGFTPKAEIVWIKTEKSGVRHFGMGRTVRNSHETCIIARRGKSIVRSHSVKSVFEAPIRGHSEKPEAFYCLVEKLAPGPYVEMFARRERRGWTCMGDEIEPSDCVPPLIDPASPDGPLPGWRAAEAR
jgi:N6-adenosine-specific RNA methylase IME4